MRQWSGWVKSQNTEQIVLFIQDKILGLADFGKQRKYFVSVVLFDFYFAKWSLR